MNQANRVWLITGVSSGIGKALSEQVLERGDTVVGTVRKTEQVDTFSALAPGRAFACHLDLSDSERVKPAVTEAIDKIGRIDVVVNCAGYGLAGAVEEVNDAELRHQMETNFFGLLQVTQAALPFMRKQRSGHIINVTSTSGQIGYPGLALYCASKHAVEGLSDALAAEVSPLGINVTIIEPDGFRTNWSSSSAIVRSQTVISDYEPTAGGRQGSFGANRRKTDWRSNQGGQGNHQHCGIAESSAPSCARCEGRHRNSKQTERNDR